MRSFLLLIGFIFVAQSLSAQNTPRFNQVNFAQGVNNPAALAIDGEIMVDMIFRNQWYGFEGAPTTGALNAQYELYHDMAVGLTASYDLIGVHHATQVSGQYAYRLYVNETNALIFGVSAGIDQRVHDLSSAQLTQSNDPAFSERYSKTHFNAGFGIFYNSPTFYAGVSIPQFFQNYQRASGSNFIPKRWHYYASTGFYARLGENYTLNPHIQVKAALNTPIQGDLILRNTIMNLFSLNVGYRTENAIIAGFDIRFGGMVRLGYSFNHNVAKLAKVTGSSNELYLGIGIHYHNSREHFSKRKYINKKGGYKRDYHKGFKQRRWYH